MKTLRKAAFTLIELLAVIVILGLLITLVSSALRAARVGAKKAQAQVEMASIETAVKAYWNKYGRLPSDQTGQDVDIDLVSDSMEDAGSAAIVSVLTMAEGANSNLNTLGIVFLEPQSGVPEGTFVDPWGYHYRIGLDADYDGRLDIAGQTIRRKVAVASVGLYVLNGASDTNDLVATWR